jgi:hypothetical protein
MTGKNMSAIATKSNTAIDYLRSRRQWLVWKYVSVPGREKPTKPPHSPVTGSICSATDPTNWATYEQARAAKKRFAADGIGFALSPDDDLTGIDLDDCIGDDGRPAPWAAEILALGETYCEVSPGGRGLRLWARGKPAKDVASKAAGVEIYGGKRYLTYTALRMQSSPNAINPAPKTIAALLARVESLRANGEKPATISENSGRERKDGFFGKVNDLAMENLKYWVSEAFPAIAESAIGWCVSSKDLCRNREEDLSITPQGIVDFGEHDMGDPREGKRTPIDCVMMAAELGGLEGHEGETMTPLQAALWLCKTLDVDPASLGWKEREKIDLRKIFEESPIDWDSIARTITKHGEKIIHVAEAGKTEAPYSIQPTPFSWRDAADIPRREWLYGRHLVRQFVSCTFAPGGLGKSSLVLAEALALVTGRPLLGVKPPRKLRVWVWNGEDPRIEIERRIAAACIYYGITAEDIGDRLFFDSGREQPLVLAQMEVGGAKVAEPVFGSVVEAIKAGGFDVVIVDPFVASHRVVENDNGAIDLVAKTWGKIADETNCAVELIHHTRKTNGAEATAEDGRGAGSLLAAARSARVLNGMTEREAERAGIADKRRTYFRVDDGKPSMAPPADESEWYQIVSVALCNGDGDPFGSDGDSVGVATRWHWPDAFEGVADDILPEIKRALSEGDHAENVQAANWAGHAVATVLGLDVEDPRDRERIKAMLKSWIDGKALRVIRRRNQKKAREQKMIVPAGFE